MTDSLRALLGTIITVGVEKGRNAKRACMGLPPPPIEKKMDVEG